jgi:predicted component of type VI protein secretion system
VALARLVERADDPAWAEATSAIPFCLDDFSALLAAGADTPGFEPVATRQLERLESLRDRLERYAHNSAQDRRHLVTDAERSAADEAARVLGGAPPPADPGGRAGRVSR